HARQRRQPRVLDRGRVGGRVGEVVRPVDARPHERDLGQRGTEHARAHAVAQTGVVAVAERRQQRRRPRRAAPAGSAKAGRAPPGRLQGGRGPGGQSLLLLGRQPGPLLVGPAVHAQLEAQIQDGRHPLGMLLTVAALDEERGAHAGAVEQVEQVAGAVVEVVEREAGHGRGGHSGTLRSGTMGSWPYAPTAGTIPPAPCRRAKWSSAAGSTPIRPCHSPAPRAASSTSPAPSATRGGTSPLSSRRARSALSTPSGEARAGGGRSPTAPTPRRTPPGGLPPTAPAGCDGRSPGFGP